MFRWFKPKSVSVASITQSLQTMMFDLDDLKVKKEQEIDDLTETIDNLQQQQISAHAEKELAMIVRTNLALIFTNAQV